MKKIEEKYDWLRLIIAESKVARHSDDQANRRKQDRENKLEEKSNKEENNRDIKEKRRWHESIREGGTSKNKTEEIREETLMIWDLPPNINKQVVIRILKDLGETKSIDIKGNAKEENRAEVTLIIKRNRETEIKDIWSIPLDNGLLVRITPGRSDLKVLRERGRFRTRIYNIPRHTREVLLMRQLKYTKAKTIHIFKNTNGHQREYAIVDFGSQADLDRAREYAISYYNTHLEWKGNYSSRKQYEENRDERITKRDNNKYKNIIYKETSRYQKEENQSKHKEYKRDQSRESQRDKRTSETEVLERVLERLERLENRYHIEAAPNRS